MADEILDLIQGPSSPLKYQEINKFLATATENEALQIFESQVTWARAPALLLSLAKKFHQQLFLLQIIEKSKCKSVRKGAAKYAQLYQENSPLTETKFLVQFLQRGSYSMRLTILNNLGTHLGNELVADEIFGAVSEHFGLFSALPILLACSSDLISRVVADNRVRLDDRLALMLLKKSPKLGIKHLEVLCRRGPYIFQSWKYRASLKFLASHHPTEYLQMLDLYREQVDYVEDFKVGSSTTKKLLGVSTDRVKLATKYHQILNLSQLRHQLPWQQYISVAAQVVRNHINSVTEIEDLSEEALEKPLKPFLRRLPIKKQQELICHCVKSELGVNLQESWKYLSAQVIFILDAPDRNVIAERKIESKDWHCSLRDINQDSRQIYIPNPYTHFWWAMKSVDESVPHLTKLLLKANDSDDRAQLSAFIVLTCVINRDAGELRKILPDLVKRARNDKARVRNDLLEALDFGVNFVPFSQDLWDHVVEILRLQQLYNESSFQVPKNLFQGYIAFCYEHNQPVAEFLQLIISMATADSARNFDLDFTCKPPTTCRPLTPKQQKALLELYAEELSKATVTPPNENPKATEEMILKLCNEIAQWNRLNGSKYGQIIVQNYPALVHALTASALPGTNPEDWKDLLSDLGSIFSTNTQKLSPQDLILVALKKDPSKLLQVSEIVISKVLSDPCRFSKYGQGTKNKFHVFLVALKRSGFQPFVDKLVMTCEKVLTEQSDADAKVANAFKVLLLLAPSTALKYIPDWAPKEPKINPAEMKSSDYNVKGAIARYLEYVPDKSVQLSLIKKFCAGDYLKMSLGTLYSAVRNAPSQTAVDFLEQELQDGPISYKKHILRLYLTVSPIKGRLERLEALWLTEKNATMRIELSMGIFKLLAQTSSSEACNLFQRMVESFSSEDTDSLSKILNNLNQLTPPEFFTKTFAVCLEALERMEASGDLRGQFNGEVADALDHLDDQFCKRLIQQKLERLRGDEARHLARLIVDYLIKTGLGLAPMAVSLQTLVQNQWNATETPSWPTGEAPEYPARSFLGRFIGSLESKTECARSVQASTHVLKELLELLKSTTAKEPWKTFKHELRIQMLLGFVGLEEEKDVHVKAFKFGSTLVRTLDEYVKKFGGEIVSLLASMLKKFVEAKFHGIYKQELVCHVIQGVISNVSDKQMRHRLIFAAILLPSESSNPSPRLEQLRYYVVDQILACSDITVKIFYDLAATSDCALISN